MNQHGHIYFGVVQGVKLVIIVFVIILRGIMIAYV